MADTNPTRSAVIEMKDERRAMHEGYVFLDEKCLLLASEALRQLALHATRQASFDALHRQLQQALADGVARHGLEGLQVHPPLGVAGASLQPAQRTRMGVRLQTARWQPGSAAAAAALEYRRALRRAHALHDVLLPELARDIADIEGRLEDLEQEDALWMRREAPR